MSETLTSPSSVANSSVSSEPGDNVVSVLYTPPWQALSSGSSSVTETASSPPPSVTTGSYKAVPVSKPDLSKVPERSALKGGKTRQLRERRRDREKEEEPVVSPQHVNTVSSPPLEPAAVQLSNTRVVPKVPPKIAPKPRVGPWVQHCCFTVQCTVHKLQLIVSI